MLVARRRFTSVVTRVGAWLGLAATALTLFYALREGYFYVEERQRARSAFDGYLKTAEYFQAADSLAHAEWALSQAAELRPNDLRVRVRRFQVLAQRVLRAVDYNPVAAGNADRQGEIRTLIREGAGLLHAPISREERATVLLAVARAIPKEVTREPGREDVTALMEEAHRLFPDRADVLYFLGARLATVAEREEEGLAMVRKALDAEPGNALYWDALGRLLRGRHDYGDAIRAFHKAASLRPTQDQLDRIRAANDALSELRGTLRDAAKAADPTGPEFFGMSLAERVAQVEFALQHSPKDRDLNWLAARLYVAQGELDRAYAAVRKGLADTELKLAPRTYRLERLELCARILENLGNEPQTLATVRELIDGKRDYDRYEDVLETGMRGKTRYRVGLKTLRDPSDDGVRVVEVIADYPFAKAGVRPGDRITQFAHRTVRSVRDIQSRLFDLAPGAEVQVKVDRGEASLDLRLVVEGHLSE